MSNYFRIGKRESIKKQKKDVKKRLKRIYQIMDELDTIAAKIFQSGKECTEDNIIEVASEFTDLRIEGMETMMLMGKLQNLKDHYGDKEIPNDFEAIRKGSFVTSKEVSE